MNELERRLLDIVGWSSWMASFADPLRTLLAVESYAYVVDARGVAIDDSAPGQTFNLIMDSDSDFCCAYVSGGARISSPAIADPANGNQVVELSPALKVQIADQSSGKTWFDVPTPLPLIAGAGGFPFIMSSPRIVRPRSTLAVTAQMISTGPPSPVAQDFFFVLSGAKLYYSGPTG